MAINSISSTKNIDNWGSESRKMDSIFNLISQQPDIDKLHLYAKDPLEAKYQFLINKRENTVLKHLNDSKAFIAYSNDMDETNIEEHNPNKNVNINCFHWYDSHYA